MAIGKLTEVDVRELWKHEQHDFSNWLSKETNLEYLNDILWIEDSVTGNASGSYWFNRYKAEEAICHNWDILADACEELCCEADVLNKGAEWADVTIRCYLLGEVIGTVLDEVYDD